MENLPVGAHVKYIRQPAPELYANSKLLRFPALNLHDHTRPAPTLLFVSGSPPSSALHSAMQKLGSPTTASAVASSSCTNDNSA